MATCYNPTDLLNVRRRWEGTMATFYPPTLVIVMKVFIFFPLSFLSRETRESRSHSMRTSRCYSWSTIVHEEGIVKLRLQTTTSILDQSWKKTIGRETDRVGCSHCGGRRRGSSPGQRTPEELSTDRAISVKNTRTYALLISITYTHAHPVEVH